MITSTRWSVGSVRVPVLVLKPVRLLVCVLAAVVALLVVAVAPVRGQSVGDVSGNDPRVMAGAIDLRQGSALFGGGAGGGGGQWSFARAVATVDPLGVAVPANVPRFSRVGAIAGQLGAAEDVVTGLGGSPVVVAGDDVDGRALVVVMDNQSSDRRVRVYTENSASDFDAGWTLRTTFNLGRPTAGVAIGANIGDVRRITGTGGDDGLLLMPRAWSVAWGTIIAFCEVYVRQTGSGTTWDTAQVRGCGYAISSDYGATWQWYEDSSFQFNNGRPRGTGWSGNGYWPLFHRKGSALTEIWVAHVDYQFAGDPPASHPRGGTVYVTRLRRAAEGQRFVPALNAAGRVRVFRHNTFVASTLQSLVYSQDQGVALGESRDGTVRVAIARSDQNWSGITILGNIDRENFDTTWYQIGDDWHGRIDSMARLSAGKQTFTGSMTSGSNLISSVSGLGTNWNRLLSSYNNGLGTRLRIAGAGAAGADLVGVVIPGVGGDAFNEGLAQIRIAQTTALATPQNASTSVTNAVITVETRGDFHTGKQFVAAAPGPDFGSVLLGGDATDGSMDLADLNAPRAILRRAWTGGRQSDEREPNDATGSFSALTNWSNHRLFVAQILVDRPEQTRSTVLATLNRTTQIEKGKPANIDKILISRDSGRPGTWAVVEWPDRSTNNPDTQGLFFTQNHLYSARASSIVRYRLPGVIVGRGVLTSPGGENHVRQSIGGPLGGYDYTSGSDNFQRAPYIAAQGGWQRVAMAGDNSGQPAGTALGPLVPQPPIVPPASGTLGNVWRVRSTVLKTGTSGPVPEENTLAVLPIQTNRTSGETEYTGTFNWASPYTGFFRLRAHVLNTTHLPESFTRPGNIEIRLRWDAYGTGASTFVGGTVKQCVVEDWDSVTITRNNTGSWQRAGSGLLLTVLAGGASLDRVENDAYVAIDMLRPGLGDYGYPTPASTTGGTADNVQVVPTSNPDEVASLNALSLGSATGRDWTIILAGRVPEDTWDQFTHRSTSAGPDTDWVIASLVADADNAIEIRPSPWITTSTGGPGWTIDRQPRLRVTVEGGGTDATTEITGGTWCKGEGFIVALRYTAATNSLAVDTVSAGVRTTTATITPNGGATHWPARVFNTLRFGNRDGTRVDSFAWYAAWRSDEALTDGALLAQLNSLDWAKNTDDLIRDRLPRP